MQKINTPSSQFDGDMSDQGMIGEIIEEWTDHLFNSVYLVDWKRIDNPDLRYEIVTSGFNSDNSKPVNYFGKTIEEVKLKYFSNEKK